MTPVEALQPAIVLLGAGTCAALASRAVRLSPIVGYLAAGLAIGPYGLSLIGESDTTHLLAELGVVFLLFDIGLHFSINEIRDSRRDILGLAPLQMLLCGTVFSIIAHLLGCSWPIAIAIGVSVALSSTAVVSRVLADRNLATCPLGRSATAVLIFQDIIAIFLLIFANSLGGDPATLPVALGTAFVQSIIAFIAAIAAGHYIVRPLFRVLAATEIQEVFTMIAILIVVSAAAATGAAGLSLTLGAFLAGLAISDSPYRHVIQTEVSPFRSLLLSFFFINVGLMINVPELLRSLPVVIGIAFGILITKSVLIFIAGRLNKWTIPGAIQLSGQLAQGSEFTLIVLAIPVITTGAPSDVVNTLMAATAVSLAVAPVWSDLGMRLAQNIATRLATETDATATTGPSESPVIVFGLTPPARLAIDALRDFNVPYIAVDSDPDRFARASADGYRAVYGDISDFRFLDAIGAKKARALVLGAPRYETSKSVTSAVRARFPGMLRFVAIEDDQEHERHRMLGMRPHLSMFEPEGIELTTDLLHQLGVDPDDVARWVQTTADRSGITSHHEILEPAEVG